MNRSREHAESLLEKAKGDAYVTERLAADVGAPEWSVGFHAQQAAEKAIKAVLTGHRIEYPRTHSLAMLLEMLRAHGLPEPPDSESLPRLTPFGAGLRYEDTAEADEAQIDRPWAVQCADRTVKWAASVLKRSEGEDT
jgi:HEPN domain-containing protein